jgi:hypothetical protein
MGIVARIGRWRSRPRSAARVAALCCAVLPGGLALAQDEWRVDDVDRVVAVADIHGAYGAFERILKRAGVVDDALAWQGEATHLVIVGDVLDRGPESKRALDLIRKLEPEALAAGGQVHLVLGNHEIMNMMGDLRYVSAPEYAAFADEEPLEIREAELERYTKGFDGDPAEAQAMFDEAFPSGFFAHREAFSSTGAYGSWLLEKPVLLVIDDVAFVHGGLADAMIVEGGRLNENLREEITSHLEAYESLVAAGMISRTTEVYDLPSVARDLLESAAAEDSPLTDDLAASLRRLVEFDSMTSFAPDGPVWYRGNVSCNRLTEQDRLAGALDLLEAGHLVVGHTPTPGAFVMSRMDQMLLRADTGMLRDYYGGRAAALIIENGRFSVLYEDESGSSPPVEQPRRVGIRPSGLSAAALEAMLATADIGQSRELGGSARLVSIVDGNIKLYGLFTPVERDAVNPAVAAYRLDRLLGLDMVPVTVPREIDGVSGALQFWPANSIDESERSAERLGGSAWCPLGEQLANMYLFDSLIFNRARTPERIRYSTDNFEVLLVGNDVTFSTDHGRPDYLSGLPVELTPAWRAALGALDEATLNEALGGVLDRRRIRATLERRDHLLELAR